MKLVLATSADLPDLYPTERPLTAELKARGHDVALADWRGDFAAFEGADAVIIRTIWDYHRHYTEFFDWLDALDGTGARVVNPTALMRWNAKKSYLVDLAEKGGPVPPTAVCEPSVAGVVAAAEGLGLTRFIVKPEIASTGEGLSLVDLGDRARLARALDGLQGRTIVQAFAPEIETAGETSFVFFGGRYSHAVVKRPVPGEIRCHVEYGGSVDAVRPPDWAIEEAAAVAAMAADWGSGKAGEPLVYARVDAIVTDDAIQLMELELIEPELFFNEDAGAPARFADALEGKTGFPFA